MNGFIDDMRDQWAQVVADGEIALANLYAAETELYNAQPLAMRDPDDAAEWQAQYDKISGVRETVDALKNAIATVRGWLSSASSWIPGLSGVPAQAMARGGNLKALPVIAGLTVAGLIALVTRISLIAAAASAFVTYLSVKDNKMQFQNDQARLYMEQGMTPEQAAEQARRDVTAQAQSETGYQFTAGINKLFLYGGLAALAVTMLPQFLGRRK